MADSGRITLAYLPPQITKITYPSAPDIGLQLTGTLREQVKKYEIAIILKTVEEAGGDRRAAAQKLDIGLSSLYRKLEEFDAKSPPTEVRDSQIENPAN
jgi:two-component system response regulator AtoC